MRLMYFEELRVGQSAVMEKRVTDQLVRQFAAVSGDANPVHLDDAYAAQTMFKHRIAHGMLSAAFISAVIGTQLPGPGAIYLGQNLKFRAPVYIGELVRTEVTVADLLPEKSIMVLDCKVTVEDREVVRGEATIMFAS